MNYIGSSLEFTKNNSTQIVGVKEANIEVVEVSTAPRKRQKELLCQTPRAGELLILQVRGQTSIYKTKNPPSTSSSNPAQRGNQGSPTSPNQGTNKEINKGTLL